MTRLYLWQENRRAHIEATRKLFLRKTEVIWKGWNVHKDFSSDIINEIICSVDCSVAAAFVLLVNRNILWSSLFPRVPDRFVTRRWAFKTLAGQPAVCLLYQTKGLNVGKRRQPPPVTSTSGSIGNISQHIVVPACLRSANLQVRE